MRPRSTVLLCAISILAFAGLVAIAGRVPISEGDDAFYASVAYALPAHGSFDVLRFYGPVFFRIVAALFSWFGLSVFVLRLASLAGVLLIVAAGLLLARSFGASSREQAWICALLLLSPEVGWAATVGRMDSLAVGLELLGLACLVRGIALGRRPALHGIAGGLLVAGATLTTPRTFPFMCGLAAAAAFVLATPNRRLQRSALTVMIAAGVTSLAICAIWIAAGAGGFGFWLRMISAIATQQRADIALFPGVHASGFGWSRVATPIAAIVGGLLIAARREPAGPRQIAAAVALVTGWTTLVVSATLFTLVFFYATYVVVPLFVVVLALAHRLPISPHTRSVLALGLLLFFGDVRIAKHVRAAVTWSARDPSFVAAFLASHVPAGSRVVGPHYLYFFPAEFAGAEYRSGEPESWADWTQWLPELGAGDVRQPPTLRAGAPQAGAMFLFWPTDENSVYGPLPHGACAPGEVVATYEPPPDDLPRLSRLAAGDDLRGYPRAVLYRLGQHCQPIE